MTGRAGVADGESTVWTPWAWCLDHAKPAGAPWGTYLRFLRCSLTCALFGHKRPVMLHKFEKATRQGRGAKLDLREACGRCGAPLVERKFKAQLRPRGQRSKWS